MERGREKGRRVRCSIGHYLRRVTGSVVTAPRFAHRLPVLQRSPTLSLSFSLPRRWLGSPHHCPRPPYSGSLSVSPFLERALSLFLSPLSLSLSRQRWPVFPHQRNLPHDSRSGHRRLDLGFEPRLCGKHPPFPPAAPPPLLYNIPPLPTRHGFRCGRDVSRLRVASRFQGTTGTAVRTGPLGLYRSGRGTPVRWLRSG